MIEGKVSDVDNSLEAAEGLISKEEIEKLKGQSKPEPKTENTETKPAEKPEVKAEESKEEPKEEKKSKNEPITLDTPFGKKVLMGGTPEEIKTLEDIQKIAKDYDFEIKDFADFKLVFDKYKEVSAKAQEGEQYKAEALQYKGIFENFPEEVAAIVYSHLNGEDYKEVLKKMNSAIDYSKPFDAHKTLSLVNHYTEQTFDKEGWDELDDRSRASLENQAKKLYLNDQAAYKDTITKPQRNATEFQKKFTQSVDTSIAQLKSQYPEMDKRQLERVRQLMERDLQSTLFNEDNTYKSDAAIRIAMQEFGQSTILQYEHTLADVVRMKQAEMESKAMEQHVSKSDLPDQTGRNVQDRPDDINRYVEQQTSFLNYR